MSIAVEDRPDPETTYHYDKYTVKFDAPVNRQLIDGEEVKLVYKAQITGTTLWHNHGHSGWRWHFYCQVWEYRNRVTVRNLRGCGSQGMFL